MTSVRAALLSFVVFVWGCPRETSDPVRPDGDPCVTDEDCTPGGASCGPIVACVDERCTTEPSRAKACD